MIWIVVKRCEISAVACSLVLQACFYVAEDFKNYLIGWEKTVEKID